MGDDDMLRDLVRSTVRTTERAVDVDGDFAELQRRLAEPPLVIAIGPRHRRWMPLAAAGVALVTAAGLVAITQRERAPRVATTVKTTESSTQASTTDGSRAPLNSLSPPPASASLPVETNPTSTSTAASLPDPECDTESIRAVLASDAEMTELLCDGPWALVQFNSDGPASRVVHRVDEVWAAWSPGPISACADDLTVREVPQFVIDALDLPCTSFDAPASYRSEPETGSLAAGDNGPRVRALQLELARQGRLTDADVDGYFGAATRDAVIDYQLATGIEPRADADTDTLRLLGLLAEERRVNSPLTVTGSTLGDVYIGQPADDAITYLTAILGPPDRDERADISFPTFSYCRDWQPRTLTWSDLTVTIARFDPRTDTPTAEPVLFGFGARSQQVLVRTTAGAAVGDSAEDWTAVHPNAVVDLIGPVDWIGPIITLDDGLIGYLDTGDGNRVTSVASSLTPVCDE